MRPERKRQEKEPKRREKESPMTTTLGIPPTTRVREEVVLRGADILKMPHDEARAWMRYQDENGWRFGNGNPVTRFNFMRSLRMWHIREEELEEKRAARREREAARKEREQERAERMAQRREREAKRQQRLADKADRLARSPAAKRQAEIEEAEARRRAADDALAATIKKRV